MLNESNSSKFRTSDGIEITIQLKNNLFGTYYEYIGETNRYNNISIKLLLDTQREPDTYEIFTRINGSFRSVHANLEKGETREEKREELEIIKNTRIEILKHFRETYNPQFVFSEPSKKTSEENEPDFQKRFSNNIKAITGAGFEIEFRFLDKSKNIPLVKARNPDYNNNILNKSNNLFK